jgi:hypothetical protein
VTGQSPYSAAAQEVAATVPFNRGAHFVGIATSCITGTTLMRTYQQLVGALVPAFLGMLRRSIFGDYSIGFLNSVTAVCVYLEGAMMRLDRAKRG